MKDTVGFETTAIIDIDEQIRKREEALKEEELLNTINLVKKHLNKNIRIEGALLTMYDARTNLSNQVVKEVKKYFEDKVYKTVIPRNVRLSEAPSYGMPITVYDPRSKGAKAYEKFAKELLKNN